MNNLSQNLYITYSKQKARDLNSSSNTKALNKVIPLDNLILELFESKNFEIIIDEIIASSVIHKIIKENKIKYFSYLEKDAVSLGTIYNFIIKCKRNLISFDLLLEGEKLDAIVKIDEAYQEYKKLHSLVDISDIEQKVLDSWDYDFANSYDEVFVDSFIVGDINYTKSKNQELILEKLSIFTSALKLI